jgi:hypothetical protein
MSFVTATTGKKLIAGAAVGWTGVIVGTDYEGWLPNYNTLGIKATDFKDPNGQDYLVWATTKMGWRYELAAAVENGAVRTALVVWTYMPRDVTAAVATATVASWSTTVTLTSSDVNKFYVNDYINNGTVSRKIVAISPDLTTVTVDSIFTWATAAVKLWSWTVEVADSIWLTNSGTTNTTIITNNQTTNLPY